jgi:hypothetical protein
MGWLVKQKLLTGNKKFSFSVYPLWFLTKVVIAEDKNLFSTRLKRIKPVS